MLLDVMGAPEAMPVMLYCWKGIDGTASNACIGSKRKGLRCSVTLVGVLRTPKISSIVDLAAEGGDVNRSSIEEELGPNGAGSLAKGSKIVDGGAVTVDLDAYEAGSVGSCTFAAGKATGWPLNPLLLSEGLISKKSKRFVVPTFLSGRGCVTTSLSL